MSTTDTIARAAPLPHLQAWRAVAGSVVETGRLLRERRIRQPRADLGRVVTFADGTHARVYRVTTVQAETRRPCVLVVGFRLRWVRGRGHRAFEWESELNTPLFVGFPGFRSKLWLAHDGTGRYRGIYEWDGEEAADHYARALWRVLALVSEPGSIDYRIVPGVRRDDHLAHPATRGGVVDGAWWSVVAS